MTVVDGKEVVDYPEFAHTDYLETVENFTAALTGKVDHEEYIARVLAMAQVYWALGSAGLILARSTASPRPSTASRRQRLNGRSSPSGLSVRKMTMSSLRRRPPGIRLQGDTRYRFHLFQWNGVETPSEDVRRILVGIEEQLSPTPT